MYDELIRSCRACATGYEGNCDNCMFSGEDCYKQLHKASAEAIEAQDRHILTLQHEMIAEAESHIAEVNQLNKQIEKLRVDVRPVVHGKWIFDCERKMHDGWTYRQYHCSACGFQMIGGSHNFCPNCGADMREET